MHLVQACARTAHREVHDHVGLDELVAYGTTGLLEAARRFDPARGATFATFAYYRIRGAIYDGLREMTDIPHGPYRRFMASQRASEYLEHAGQRSMAKQRQEQTPPSTTATVRQLYDTLRSAATAAAMTLAQPRRLAEVSPDELPDHSPNTWPDAIAISPGSSPAAAWLEHKQLVTRLRRAITALPDKERHFVEQCYFHDRSVTEAGKQLGLSKSWSSRLHARAIDRLRELLDDE